MSYRGKTAAEYAREYRARYGGSAPADKARRRADQAAAKWVLHNMPELYGNLLAEARASLGLPLETGPSGNFTKAIQHGTYNGAQAHRYRNETPCDDCIRADREYKRDQRRRRKMSQP